MSGPDVSAPDPRLAVALRAHRAGDGDTAERLYREILEDNPKNADALHLRGVLAQQRGDSDRAAVLIGEAIAIDPKVPDYHNAMGETFRARGRFGDAIRQYRRALGLDADLAGVHNNLGLALEAEGILDEAEEAFRRALEIAPEHGRAHSNLGVLLKATGRLDQAVGHYAAALAIDPDDADARNNMGNILVTVGRLDEAVVEYRRAIARRPDFAQAFDNLGVALKDLGQLDEAIESHRRAIALRPDLAEAHKNLGLALLLGGDFENGFAEYDWRWRARDAWPRPFSHPRWTGEPLAGTTLLAWGEQGIGDEVMYASVLDDVIAAGARLVIECDERLASLFARSFPDAEVVARAAVPDSRLLEPMIDRHSATGSLCRWLRRSARSFAAPRAYLTADPEQAARIRARYDALGRGPKIGVAWRSKSGVATVDNIRFSIAKSSSLNQWYPVLMQADAVFVNLQYGDCAEELEAVEHRYGVRVHHDSAIDQMADLDGFAAQIAALDIVVATSNAAVHLAGALGKEVWTLIPKVPDWRWQLDRDDSLWYPRMRLFRQTEAGDWDRVLARVGAALAPAIEAGRLGAQAM